MTPRSDGESEPQEPVTVTDKRRVDPVTGEIRTPAAGPTPRESGSAAGAGSDPALEAESDEAKELLADLQRVQADFANYRKRALRDHQVAGIRAKASVITQLLPVLDDLDRARSHGDLDSGPLKAVADKLVTALEGLGLSAFGEEGEAFDPALHEAVQHEGDGSHPVVGAVLRRGYKVGDQVVRHAMVGVVDTVPEGDTGQNVGEPPGQAAESDS